MSIEIPDAATFAALAGYDKRRGYSQLERMRDALEAALPHLIPAITADYNKKLLAWAQDVDPSGRTREILHHFAALAGTEGDDGNA